MNSHRAITAITARSRTAETGDEATRRDASASSSYDEEVAELMSRRSALTPSEVALLRKMYPAIFRAHHGDVWRVLWSKGVRPPSLSDLAQDVFMKFYCETESRGFPEDIRTRLRGLAAGLALNHQRKRRRDPTSLAPVPPDSEPPASSPEIECQLDFAALRRRLVPALPPPQRAVIEAVCGRGLTYEAAAAELDIALGTLTYRLTAAQARLIKTARKLLQEGQG